MGEYMGSDSFHSVAQIVLHKWTRHLEYFQVQPCTNVLAPMTFFRKKTAQKWARVKCRSNSAPQMDKTPGILPGAALHKLFSSNDFFSISQKIAQKWTRVSLRLHSVAQRVFHKWTMLTWNLPGVLCTNGLA